MRKIFIVSLLLFTFATAETNATDSNETNTTAWKTKSVKNVYTMEYDKNTTCMVRKFKVYKDPKWVGKIETRGGKTVYFSSPKSLFEFYHQPGKWFDVGVKSERDFSKIVVTDYETLKLINAETAFYVYGSRATSPAGDDLVALGTKESAEAFSKKYNGKRIFEFDKVSDALIRLLNGRI
ncbi:MAG: nitrous oxide reductase accessory protein NosL [Sulfurovaceae bacterium]|nr:nitrous oxide reductase accessory protein NosL [Sulfurovaceae bacterium]